MAFLSFPEAKFQLPRSEDAQIAKFRGFGFNSDTAVSTFNFSFTSCFLSLFLSRFFSFAGHLLAFILLRKVSGKLLVSQDLMEGGTGG